MARHKSVAFFFLASLLPLSILYGVAISACILALLIPFGQLWYTSCRVALRDKPGLRMSKAQKRRALQKIRRARCMRHRRETQRCQRVLWKLRKSCGYNVATLSSQTCTDEVLRPISCSCPRVSDNNKEPCGLPVSYAPDMHDIEESKIESRILSISPAIIIPGYRWAVLLWEFVHTSRVPMQY